MSDDNDKSLALIIEDHLRDNRDSLAERAVSQAVESLSNSLRWKAEETATTQLTKFYENEVAPEIEKHLQQNREHIIAAIVSVIGGQVELIAKKLAEDMSERLGKDYERKKILEALFGVGRGY